VETETDVPRTITKSWQSLLMDVSEGAVVEMATC
jgi:hypothetical protein